MLCLHLPHLNLTATYRISVNAFLSPWLTISNFFYWSVVALQCCVIFCYTAKWICHTYTYIPSVLDFQKWPQIISCSSQQEMRTLPFPLSLSSVQFSSVAQLCPTLCDHMDGSMPGLPVHHQLPEFTQTLVHWVGDAIQPSHPLSSPSPPAFNLFQHQGLFQWVSPSNQVAKVLEFQLQNQSSQ